MTPRRLFSRRDGAVILMLLALAAVLFSVLSRNTPGTAAVVTYGDTELFRQDLTALNEETALTFTGEDGHTVTIVFSPAGARVTEADCPDQICVRTGALTHAGDTAICLPARISLMLTGTGSADAVTY